MTETPFSTAQGRWAGVGPYYAMFPLSFVETVIKNHTNTGDIVLDPFSGRGTAVFKAASLDRCGVGVEINPVGWVYTKAKISAAHLEAVSERIEHIGRNSFYYRRAAKRLPEFFHHCFTEDVRTFLLTARSWLNWRQSKVDWTLMALLLVHLHGKRTDSFSNQMRQTKSMSPPYAIRWWNEHGHDPPEIEPVEFMKRKLKWRYAKGTPAAGSGYVYLGDSVARVPELERRVPELCSRRVQLLLTSPPYCGVTNYHYDQWLRLWLLGGPEAPTAPIDSRRGKFVHQGRYRELIRSVFQKSASLLSDDAVVYVRTDRREVTRKITCEVLRDVFPQRRMRCQKSPFPKATQTDLFGGKSSKDGELDIVLRV